MKRLATWMMTPVLLSTLIACDASDSMTSADAAIEDPTGEWTLQSFQRADGSTISVPDPSRYTLGLGVSDAGRADIRADCNRCNGRYQLAGSALVFGPRACTLAACPPGSLEADYLFALGSTSMYQRSGDVLTLDYDGGVMRFQAR